MIQDLTIDILARECLFVLSNLLPTPPDISGLGDVEIPFSEIQAYTVSLAGGKALRMSLEEYSKKYIAPAMLSLSVKCVGKVFIKPSVTHNNRVVALNKVSLSVAKEYDFESDQDSLVASCTVFSPDAVKQAA